MFFLSKPLRTRSACCQYVFKLNIKIRRNDFIFFIFYFSFFLFIYLFVFDAIWYTCCYMTIKAIKINHRDIHCQKMKKKVWCCIKINLVWTKMLIVLKKVFHVNKNKKKLMLHKKMISCRGKQDDATQKKNVLKKIKNKRWNLKFSIQTAGRQSLSKKIELKMIQIN